MSKSKKLRLADRRDDPSFIVWVDHTKAYLCDRETPLVPRCKVVVTEHGHAWADGLLMTPEPARGKKWPKRVSVRADSHEPNMLMDVPIETVVRVVGVYKALHEKGALPRDLGPASTVGLHRQRIAGDGAPFPSRGVILPHKGGANV